MTGRVSPISAALTQSRTLVTKAKVEPAKAKKASAKAKKEPAKAKKEKKQPKVDARKRGEFLVPLLELVNLVDFCFFASPVKLPAPSQPANPYIRFTSHYYKTHEVKKPVPFVVGDITHAYAKLTPEEKKVSSA